MDGAAEHVDIADRAVLHEWLAGNHEQRDGVWIVFLKGAQRTMTYGDIVEEVLSFGWIDSKTGRVDDQRSKLWLAPRRRGSAWSRRNKEIVEALEEPPDLQAALADSPTARTHWDAFPRSTKRGVLEWISTAKRPETRAKRIRQTVDEAVENRRANQWRAKT